MKSQMPSDFATTHTLSNALREWTIFHSQKYKELYPNEEVPAENLFEYVDSMHSNIFHVLTHNMSVATVVSSLKSAIEQDT